MKNRLEIARELLRDDGVIFVQCDDNEQAYLKVLMDEIFGRDNFVCNFIWKKTNNPNLTKNNLGIQSEYIVCFSKKIDFIFEKICLDEEDIAKYKFFDENGRYKLVGLNKTGTINDKRPNLEYIIKSPENTCIYPKPRWRWSKEKFEWALKNNRIVFSKNKNEYSVYYKQYIDEDNDGNKIVRSKLISNLLLDNGTTTEGTSEITKLLNKGAFNFPKAENLLQRIIEISTNENDLVLDFFAGSGTTLAVAHKMKRRYIGIEQMEYIESITKERLKKVIDGEQGGISKAVNWQGGGNLIYCELASLNAKFIEKIENSSDENELNQIYENLQKLAFIDYRVDIKNDLKDVEFLNLDFINKKRILKKCLDRNMDYIPYADMDDSEYKIDERAKKLNKIFYGENDG